MNKTPKLRFKEFNEEWKNKKINEIYNDLKAGSTPSKSVPKYFKGDIPWITSGELKTKYIYKTNEYITEEAVKSANLKIYEEGTFFIAITGLEAPGTRGSCAINKVKATTNQSCLAFQKNSKIKNEFLYYWYLLNGEYIGIKFTQGTKQQSLNNELVGKLCINMPSIEEQEKIVSFLSLIDDKIYLQCEKVEALKNYKKGMIQKIFSRELRFKDDEEIGYPEWESKKLSEVLRERKENNTGDLRVCSVAVRKGVIDQIEHLGRSFAAKDTSNYNLVKYGDIIYTKSPTGDFPYGIVKQSFLNEDVVVSPLYGVFEPLNFSLGYILHCYFYYKENTSNYLYSIVQKGAKNTINITNTTFLSKSLVLPMDEDEQRKIAGLLMKLDNKIEKEQEKLDFLNEYKKGLLQQMFV